MSLNKGILKVAGCFDYDAPAPNVLYRDEQYNAVYSCIEPALEGGSPVHTVISGDYATGKTTLISQIIDDMKNKTNEIIPVYIDCQHATSQLKFYSFIFKEVFNKNKPDYYSASRVKEKIMNRLNKTQQPLVVVLDDVYHLLAKSWCGSMLSKLLRAYQMYGVRIGVFNLLPSLEFKFKFDQDLRTMYVPYEIEFPRYTLEEVYGILKDRCCYGFHDGVINKEVLMNISEEVVELHNLRFGMGVLRNLSIKANIENRVIDMDLYTEINKSSKKFI